MASPGGQYMNGTQEKKIEPTQKLHNNNNLRDPDIDNWEHQNKDMIMWRGRICLKFVTRRDRQKQI